MLGQPLSERESQTLALICDTIIPPGESAWRTSIAERAARILRSVPNPDDVAQLSRLLALMEVPAAGLALAGQWTAFASLDRAGREMYLRALARHRLSLVRGGFQALKRLVALAYYADADRYGHNPVWATLHYPGPIAPSRTAPKTIQPMRIEEDVTLDCDVVVVGSGAGGGMVAAELTEAGHDVIVIECGGYFNQSDFNQREVDMLQKLYFDRGLSASKDQGLLVLAGSCLGGGTVVNYTTSFRTPDSVRQEWARVSGLDLFVRDEFSRSLDAACDRLHVNLEHNQPSTRDALMAEGLKWCGWQVDRMPRDVEGCTQDDVCGYCGLGCVRGAKCSTLKTCLQGVFDLGARILVCCTVQQVLIDNGRASGVVARTDAGQEVRVRARAVVVAAGSIGSPALLLRSGLGPPVGENLRLHPATVVWGRFEQEVRPWTGTLQAYYSDQFADLDSGYGFRFETAPLHPGLQGAGAPWEGADQFDALMRRISHTSPVGILLRDRFGGQVTISRIGLPVIHYQVSRYDQRHVRKGVEAAAQVLLAAGAQDIFSTQNRPVGMEAGKGQSIEDWLRRVDRVGYGANQTLYVTFHQMGTCRMGSRAATSVVDGSGETHAVKNLFVADASIFPTASGVNPMVTVAALAHYVAQQIKSKL